MSDLNDLQQTPLQPIGRELTPPSSTAPRFSPMLQGTATNQFRLTATKNIVIDRNGNATIDNKGFKAFMKGYTQLKGGLNIGAKKLLDIGSMKLATNNHFRSKEGQRLETSVAISLEEYGRMRGYDLVPRKTTTPEEEEAEKTRITSIMHNIRKRANSELELLFSLSLSWTEPGKRKNADYTDVRVLQSKGIKGGYILMRFSEDMADYLSHAFIMQYPLALQGVDERNPRTYNIGYKLAFHHGMDSNRANGTNNIISVSALLEACGDMPTFEEIQTSTNRGHWERLIKDPLEKVLDTLQADGVIQQWEYCNSKGKPLEDMQASIADYHTFTRLYIFFTMEGEPDQSERLQRKAERKYTRMRSAASKKKD